MSSRAQRGICSFTLAAALCVGWRPSGASGQSLGDRVTRVDGLVQFVFASREDVCGDGRGQIGNVLRKHEDCMGYSRSGGGSWKHSCVSGPARVVVTVVRGEVTRLKTYVGPVPSRDSDVLDLGEVTPADARAWLLSLAQHADVPVAREAILPMLIADAPLPWPELLALARDDNRPAAVRRDATFWLAQGASARVAPDDDASDADDVRKSAVFALSQQSRDFAVPALIQVATGNADAPVRAAALFWLGQTGDPRGLAVFAQVLEIAGLPRPRG